MADRGLQAGQSFLSGILSKLTPEQRQQAEDTIRTLGAIHGGAVIAAIGDGTLAQAELSRLTADAQTRQAELDARAQELEQQDAALTTWKDGLTSWKEANEADLQLGKKARAANWDGTSRAPAAPVVTAGLTEEQLNERIAGERAAYLGFNRDQTAIMREHFDKFKTIVDVEPLLTHPQIRDLGLVGVYRLVHKDALEKWDKDEAQKKEEAIRLDERQKVQAAQASMPYPSPTGVGSGSPLDALEQKAEPVVDAATAHYNRLQQERMGAAR